MDVQKKLVVFAAVILLGVTILVLVITVHIFSKNFAAFEDDKVATHMARAYGVYMQRLASMESVADDCSKSNGICVPERVVDMDVARMCMTYEHLSLLKMDFFMLVSPAGEVMESWQVDRSKELLVNSSDEFNKEMGLLLYGKGNGSGVVRLSSGGAMVALRSILKSEGRASAVLVFGRYFDEKEGQLFSSLLHQEVTWKSYNASLFAGAKRIVGQGNYSAYALERGAIMDEFVVLPDVGGNPVFVVQLLYNRDLKSEADGSIHLLIVSAVIVAMMSIVVMGFLSHVLLKKTRLQVQKLNESAKLIIQGDLSVKFPVVSKDEIGSLALTLEAMRKKLKESKDVLESANAQLEGKVRERTDAFEKKNKELEKFNRFLVGREVRMAELKKEIADVKARLHNGGEKK